ncbi:MAG: hypothetical protein ACOY37_04385 [Pseudomonadota bacterium]
MHHQKSPTTDAPAPPGTKRWLVIAAIAACLASWTAFAVGLAAGVDTSARFFLLTVALLITEAVFWLGATLLGITAFQLRRRLIGALVRQGLRHAG